MSTPLIERALIRGLESIISRGSLTVVDSMGREHHLGEESASENAAGEATVILKRPTAARQILIGGLLGVAEGYLDGAWETPDLDAVLTLGVANLGTGTNILSLTAPATRAWHRLRDNDHEGAKRNIEYHYDLGNEFYRLWLDETMAYSCALCGDGVPSEDGSLAEAQRRKWDRLLELLAPTADSHILEIGCGWGGFAIHAAQRFGCRVTGLTLSQEQFDWAARAVEDAGVSNLVAIRLQDYRDVTERFSHIASIEMFEAVGERWWPTYFECVERCLEPGGAAAIQTITIEEARYDDYRRNPDFIQRYVFPGGQLPSPERFAQTARGAGLVVDGTPSFFGEQYAQTLDAWSIRFEAVLPEVQALGFDDRFIRMWRYYLAYCAAGFRAGTINVMQVRLIRE